MGILAEEAAAGKIDPILYERITANNSGEHSAVIYAYDFPRARERLSAYKLRIIKEFPFIDAFGVYFNADVLREIAAHEYVRYVVNQSTVFAQMDVARSLMSIDNFHARGILGAGITIAVIDTGVYPHLDFTVPRNRILKFKDFIDGRTSPYDDNGHGTFVAGTALGNGLIAGGTYSGVAPHADLVALRAMNKKGEGGAFGILEAMQWVYNNAEEYRIRVVCMSFGSALIGANDPLIEGAEALWKKGITVVAAAGNNGPLSSTIKSPGASSLIITVGALDPVTLKVADFSSRGPVGNLVKPDIIAPAVNIISTSTDDVNHYSKMSGTSVAAPMAAGLAALLLQYNPSLTPPQIKSILISSALKLGNDRNSEGAGLMEAPTIR